jgi:hypothetical protein
MEWKKKLKKRQKENATKPEIPHWKKVDFAEAKKINSYISEKRREHAKEDSKKIIKDVVEYLHKTPFALTFFEMVRAEGGGFLKEYRAKSKGKEEKKDWQTSVKLEALVNNTDAAGEDIARIELDDVAWGYFRLRQKHGTKYLTTVPGEEGHKKIAVRMILEYVDIFLKRRIDNAKLSFKILQELATAGEKWLTAKELVNKIYKEDEKTRNSDRSIPDAIERENLLKRINERPALVKRKKGKRKNKRENPLEIYTLTKFFKEVWEIAIDEDTIELWDDWKKKEIRAQLEWGLKRR